MQTYSLKTGPRISLGVFLVALTTLLLELTLIRIFDVLWYPNMAHMVITLAIFSFGLAGVYSTLRPARDEANAQSQMVAFALALALLALCLLPILDHFKFNLKHIGVDNKQAVIPLMAIYVGMSLPFFACGMVLTLVFSTYAKAIQRLYFWDLVGAALGSIIIVPLIPLYGGPGLLFLAGAIGFLAVAALVQGRNWRWLSVAVALCVALLPFLKAGYIHIDPHMDKRSYAALKSRTEVERWDPISKIDIIHIDVTRRNGRWSWDPISKTDVIKHHKRLKWIAYDGGTQTSYFYQFDGNYKQLREGMPKNAQSHFWGKYVALSHYLKRDTDQSVLVIGSAGGQETKAALAYGATDVDGIELVGSVVDLGKNEYDQFIGGVFTHPNVNIRKGEGRSHLRSTDKRYDIIQILSNHTSSSIAAGSGAMRPTFLQTAEAYQEYFNHLSDDGVLQINHHIYPRMVTTAALAWRQMERSEFRRHVIVFEGLTLPTMLIKMSPWTRAEMDEAIIFMAGIKLAEHPLKPSHSFLSDEFYSGTMRPSTLASIPYRVAASTDNRPYFNHLRNNLQTLEPDPKRFLNFGTSHVLNSRMQGGIPIDLLNFFVTGGAALVFAAVFLFVPLVFSRAGRSDWGHKTAFLAYFACLGAGFIILELVFTQLFMRLIGYPLYTYSTVVFTFLFSAGIGSLFSERLGIHTQARWKAPFVGTLVYGVLFLLLHNQAFEFFLQTTMPIRILASVVLIFPLGFFLGMPFPLGVLLIKDREKGTIAWAWAINGFFTVVGGLASVLVAIYLGFINAIIVALACYALAFLMYAKMRPSLQV